jgi:hypothetical protein
LIQIRLDLFEENLKPDNFFDNVGYINIFGLTKGEGYNKLLFGGLGNGNKAQVKNITGG